MRISEVYLREKIEEMLDKVSEARAAKVRAAIDATACNTPLDHRKAREASQAYFAACKTAVDELVDFIKTNV